MHDDSLFNKTIYEASVISNSKDEALRKTFGERYNRYRMLWDGDINESIIPFPLCIDLMLEDSCNLRCAICHKRKRTHEQLSKGLLKRLFDECREHELCSVTFGLDSEALYNSDILFYAIECAENANVMDIIIGTNGILLTEDISKKIIQSKTTMINISLDAVTEETYKKLRHSNSFHKIENNIKNFLKLRNCESIDGLPKVRVSFCNTYANKHEKENFIEKWSNVVDYVDIQNYISLVGEFNQLSLGRKINSSFCKQPFRRVGILANGDVQCCCTFSAPDIIIGNINNNSLYDIWNGEKMKKIQDAFYSHPNDIPNYCKICLDARYQF